MTIKVKTFQSVGQAIGGGSTAASPSTFAPPPPAPAESKKTMKGIYQLEGDTLKLCLTLVETDSRPTEFKSLPGDAPAGGFGPPKGATILVTLKREKP